MRYPLPRKLACVVALLVATGCGSGASVESYTPPPDVAKSALEATLAAWKGGQPLDKVQSGTTPVHVLDAEWTSGRKLTDYKIVGERTAGGGENARQFDVTLTVEGGTTGNVVYFVIGQSPVMVARDKDYNKISGM